MYILLTIIHVLAALVLILVVLLQAGKGASMGAIFGGAGSQTLFGPRGAGNFLTKMTAVTAVIFMATSLSLAMLSRQRTTSSVIERAPEPPKRGAPAHLPYKVPGKGAIPPAKGAFPHPAPGQPGSHQ